MHIRFSVVQLLNEIFAEMSFCPFVRTTIIVKTLKF